MFFDIFIALGLDGREVMSSTSRFPHRYYNLVRIVPIESVFPSTFSAVAIN